MIASYRESLSLIDREKNPAEWIKTVTILGDTLYSWDHQSGEGADLLVEAYDWADREFKTVQGRSGNAGVDAYDERNDPR